MKISIKNCNNISNGEVDIVEYKLNIKYGINGTGKSTIAKAIQYKIEGSDQLKDLTPFRLRDKKTEIPEVEIDEKDKINSVFIFNEDYLNRFLYKEDELVSNSFEIFIKTPEYNSYNSNIEDLLKFIKDAFSNHAELEQIISDFESLSKNFKTTQKGISRASQGYKALESGNKLEHIPEALKPYSQFLKHDDHRTNWLDWQIKGEKFLEISDNCPYCIAGVSEKKEVIKSISKTYDKKVIESLTSIIDAIKSLGDYFSEETKQELY